MEWAVRAVEGRGLVGVDDGGEGGVGGAQVAATSPSVERGRPRTDSIRRGFLDGLEPAGSEEWGFLEREAAGC